MFVIVIISQKIRKIFFYIICLITSKKEKFMVKANIPIYTACINRIKVVVSIRGLLRTRIEQSKRFHSDSMATTATLLSCFTLHQPVVPPTRQSNLHVRWLLADTTTEYKRCPICKCQIVHTHYRPVYATCRSVSAR